ncbi:MAG TPA: phasin family protein [Rhodanobacteraceae bacterium]|nr:phasin family protein [Rhodanobacteraceae bacterium]
MTEPSDPFKAAKDAATSGQRFSRGVMDSAQQIWLAGLGALSRTQQEGGKFFDALVEEGVRIQEKTHAYTQEQVRTVREQSGPWLEGARKRTSEAVGKLEQAFDARIARAVKRMQVPTHADIEALSSRIDALTRELQSARAARGNPAPRKSAPRKPAASKPTGKA